MGETVFVLHARLEPIADARLAKGLRSALQRRHANPPGPRLRIRRVEAWRLHLTNQGADPVTELVIRSRLECEDGDWLIHGHDDDKRIAWGFRFNRLRDFLDANALPAELSPGTAAGVVVATWLADMGRNELRNPSLDLEFGFTTGGLRRSAAAELLPEEGGWAGASRPGTLSLPPHLD